MARSSAQAKSAAERQRQPTEIRRVLIVDAARDVIAERGLSSTTVRDIAQAAGVSIGTLTYHFAGVAEILSEVLDREMALFYDPIIEKARTAERGADGVQSLIDCFFSDDERTVQHWRLWLDFWSVSVHDEPHASWQRDIYLRWRADVQRMFTIAAEQGHLPPADVDTTVSDFLAMFDGLAVQAYQPRSPLGPEDARRHLTDWVRRTLKTARTAERSDT